MGFSITYKTLLELGIWHHQLLDTSSEDFSLPPALVSPAIEQRLLQYNLRELLAVQPTPTTAKLLAQKRLLFKQTTTGCLIVSQDSYTEPDPSFRISLAINITDPVLLDYTDIDGLDTLAQGLNRRLFHLTNFSLLPAARTLLTAGGTDALRETHFVPRQGRIVRLPQQVPGTNTTVNVLDALSSSPTPVLTTDIVSEAGQTDYEIDCRSLPEGLYRFDSANIDASLSPIYLGLEDFPNLLGVVDLFLASWEEGIFDIRLAKT